MVFGVFKWGLIKTFAKIFEFLGCRDQALKDKSNITKFKDDEGTIIIFIFDFTPIYP